MSALSDAQKIVGAAGPLARIAYGLNVWTGERLPLEIDPITWGLHIIESEHHEIHEGTSYTAYYTRTTDNSNSHRTGLYLKTALSAAPRVHVVASFSVSHSANLAVCEGVTIAANTGTHTGTIINRNRNSARQSACFNNATVPVRGLYTTLTEAQLAADGTWDTGTVLRAEPLRVGGGPQAVGGVSRGTQEYVLKADTAYVFLITNTAANANTHWIAIDWYEHKRLDH